MPSRATNGSRSRASAQKKAKCFEQRTRKDASYLLALAGAVPCPHRAQPQRPDARGHRHQPRIAATSSSRSTGRRIRHWWCRPRITATPSWCIWPRYGLVNQHQVGRSCRHACWRVEPPSDQQKKNSRTIDAGGSATVWSTVDHGPFVTPDHIAGNTRSDAIHRKALAAQQQQFARSAARVSTDATVRGNHAMTRDVDRHRIVVQCIADRSRTPRDSHGSA